MGLRGPKPKRAEVAWSPNMAYAVGLMATDGCLSKDGRHIELTSKDIDQLENFMRCIDKKIRITTKHSGYTGDAITRVQFSDVSFYRFLVSIGLTPDKTHTLGALNVPDIYFFDFLRGLYDGDGSFYSYYDPRWRSSYLYYLSFVSASRDHVNWLRDQLSRLLGVRGHINSSSRSGVYQLRYAKREAFLILGQMYNAQDVSCLKRKRLKIERALRIVSQSLPSS